MTATPCLRPDAAELVLDGLRRGARAFNFDVVEDDGCFVIVRDGHVVARCCDLLAARVKVTMMLADQTVARAARLH